MRNYYFYEFKDQKEVEKVTNHIFRCLKCAIRKRRDILKVEELISISKCIEDVMVDINAYQTFMNTPIITKNVNNLIEYTLSKIIFNINVDMAGSSMEATRRGLIEYITNSLYEYKFNDIIMRDKLTVFLSHPMSSLTDEQVQMERDIMINNINEALSYMDITYIDNYHHDGAPEDPNKLWHLGASIQQLGDADCIFFHRLAGAKGVKVEKVIAELYEIPVLNDIIYL